MVNLPLTGGCQCGDIRYEITTEPSTLYACHCSECQRQSGAAFGMSIKVSVDGFRLRPLAVGPYRRLGIRQAQKTKSRRLPSTVDVERRPLSVYGQALL